MDAQMTDGGAIAKAAAARSAQSTRRRSTRRSSLRRAARRKRPPSRARLVRPRGRPQTLREPEHKRDEHQTECRMDEHLEPLVEALWIREPLEERVPENLEVHDVERQPVDDARSMSASSGTGLPSVTRPCSRRRVAMVPFTPFANCAFHPLAGSALEIASSRAARGAARRRPLESSDAAAVTAA